MTGKRKSTQKERSSKIVSKHKAKDGPKDSRRASKEDQVYAHLINSSQFFQGYTHTTTTFSFIFENKLYSTHLNIII